MSYWFSLPCVSVEVGETIESLKEDENVFGNGNKLISCKR